MKKIIFNLNACLTNLSQFVVVGVVFRQLINNFSVPEHLIFNVNVYLTKWSVFLAAVYICDCRLKS